MKLTIIFASILILLVISVHEASGDCNHHEWAKYKLQFGKKYTSESEDEQRQLNFCKNLIKINEHNTKTNSSFRVELNHMSDLSDSQMKYLVNYEFTHQSYVKRHDHSMKNTIITNVSDNVNKSEVPDKIDWRDVPNRVGSWIGTQGDCGSCWAFATVGLLEGQQKVTEPSIEALIPLSVQNLVDCDTWNKGCIGGQVHRALWFIKSAGGLQTDADYPYVSNVTNIQGECNFDKTKVCPSSTHIKAAKTLEVNDELNLKQVIANYGPVAASIWADWSFFQYKSGVYYDPNCINFRTNHFILIIGYGSTKEGEDYWIIKNSFGPGWGEQGFARMARNKDNHCGIASNAVIYK